MHACVHKPLECTLQVHGSCPLSVLYLATALYVAWYIWENLPFWLLEWSFPDLCTGACTWRAALASGVMDGYSGQGKAASGHAAAACDALVPAKLYSWPL